jgi:mannose-6-phosphate isomerase-like protein (cupin superfamily)
MKYKYSEKEAKKFNKYGIDLTVYPTNISTANVVKVSVKEGHFQEFYDVESTFIYTIIEGNGTFYLNDEEVQAEKGDQIVIPPKTRIHYFGTMKMVLVTTPAFNPDNERHVRLIEKSESPYQGKI